MAVVHKPIYTDTETGALSANPDGSGPVGGSGSGGHTIEDEGTPLTARDTLNFVGGGVTVTDVGGTKTQVSIPSAPGSAHAADHAENATDELLVENLGTATLTANRVPKADGTGGLAMGQIAHSELNLDAGTHHAEDHDHNGTGEQKLLQANTHETPDTDSGATALHHTLGTGANHAAAGNHTHAASGKAQIAFGLARPAGDAAVTFNVNNQAYQSFSTLRFGVDFDAVPYTHFRILARGAASAVGQTITFQLAEAGTPTTPLSSLGNDASVTGTTVSDIDSGWVAFASAQTGFKWLVAAIKGSTSTLDFTNAGIMVLLKKDP